MPSRSPTARRLIAVVVGLLASVTVWAAELVRPLVVHVTDGDTVSVMVAGIRYRVDVAAIDAPEIDQPHGVAAKRALAALVFNRHVWLSPSPTGDGSSVDMVVDGQHVARSLVVDGHAWAIGDVSFGRELQQAQSQARSRRHGLWRASSPIAPWSWRRGLRSLASSP